MAASLSMGESHRRITEYLNLFSDAISSQDPDALSCLISASSSHTSSQLSSVADALSAFPDWPSILTRHQRLNSTVAADLVPHVLRSLHSFRLSRFLDSHASFEKFANAFLQEFRNWETAWALRPMYAVAYEIRVLAERVL